MTAASDDPVSILAVELEAVLAIHHAERGLEVAERAGRLARAAGAAHQRVAL